MSWKVQASDKEQLASRKPEKVCKKNDLYKISDLPDRTDGAQKLDSETALRFDNDALLL